MGAGEVVYRMGSRWRQESKFRYARMHFDLGSHDSYTSNGDDEDRMVTDPANADAYQLVVAACARHAEAAVVADLNLLALKKRPEGTGEGMVSSAMHNQITAPV